MRLKSANKIRIKEKAKKNKSDTLIWLPTYIVTLIIYDLHYKFANTH